MKFAARPATVPGPLPEWDPEWSRLVTVDAVDGARTFHVLDTLPALRARGLEPTGTILALHGNPTWSYLWRGIAAASLADTDGRIWRVIAPDQLEMGHSERLAHDALPTTHGSGYRRIAERVSDVDAVMRALLADTADAAGAQPHPVVTLGHDWGGIVSLTWAARNRDVVDGVISLNTGVHLSEGTPLPSPLRAALSGPVLPMATVLTDGFLRTTLSLGQGPLRAEIKDAFRSPYLTADERSGIGAFVADIPARPGHPSYDELQQLAEDIAGIDAPSLLVWGPKDPVFVEHFLRDLRHRLPHADVHRVEKASHLVSEDADVTGVVLRWLRQQFPREAVPALGDADVAVDDDPAPMIFEALDARRDDASVASVDMTRTPPQAITWRQLTAVSDGIARGLQRLGLQRGDRVSLLVTPGNDLTAVLYGVLKAGGVAVVADSGLGPAGMTRAIRASDPQWIIGLRPGLALARAAGWPGRRISVYALNPIERAALGVETSVTELSRTPAHDPISHPGLTDDAVILFTSGSTGPAKGVRYTHARLGALARTLREQFNVHEETGWAAGFAPFALLGPGLGISSVTPDMSVTKPRTLTAAALADAILAGASTMVFASPAAYTNVQATAGELTTEQRASFEGIELVLSAGAPVPLQLLDALAALFPNAEIRSPYGMTEGLLLTDINREGVTAAEEQSRDHGVCVGRPVPRVRFAVAPLDAAGVPGDEVLTDDAATDVLGEFVVSAPHIKAGYDRLWDMDASSKRDDLDGLIWHRTNDIGHIDPEGRIWIEGRVQHVLTPASGPLGPGGIEAVVDTVPQVYRSAVVGVGPTGTQSVVVVVEPRSGVRMTSGLAPMELADAIRAAVAEHYPHDIAAVLVSTAFPTDIRHNSKIDRTRLAVWADAVLRGGRVGTP
ncbi:alpha/beta fold hydrolase [Microbacterium gubbeenense]|uniref:alpha/beta fold hydrolase n=1 Tax=Microbacterium gubbeenense TaxID=159896 RepID=UPI003F9B849A